MNKPCPYAEVDPRCGKCVTCHAINPSARAPNRRLCTRTRQWPSCARYLEAWRIGVTPYQKGYAISKEEQKTPTGKGGIGGLNMSRGLPVEAGVTAEPPCRFLVFKVGGCRECGGYVCKAASNRRIMDAMVETCTDEPGECAIHENKEGE